MRQMKRKLHPGVVQLSPHLMRSIASAAKSVCVCKSSQGELIVPGDKPYPKLFIQHIPKTGTTSILNALRVIYGKKNVQRLAIPSASPLGVYIRDPQSDWHMDRDNFVVDCHDWIQFTWDRNKYDDVPVLHGHHPFRVIWPLLRDTGRKLVTWVRDPISLAISWFYWDKANLKFVHRSPLSMSAYLEEGIRNNILTQMLGWDIDYDFIGIQEWMKQDWQTFCAKYDFPMVDLLFQNKQPNNYDHAIIDDPAMVRLIAMHNHKDLYRYGELVGKRFQPMVDLLFQNKQPNNYDNMIDGGEL
jgi:hypothetical protein